ncbi:unnamed protein product [Rotaria sp. Silwood1]|nr:unnamed protein product [Rotaria sp. Silwood1]
MDRYFHLEKALSSLEQRIRKVHRYDKNYGQLLLEFNVKLRSDIQQSIESYAQLWNIHQIILIINLNRLYDVRSRFTLREYFMKQGEKNYEFSVEEWFTLLEFYLQMDGTCFYMKSCTFRNSKPHWDYVGLFTTNEPKSYYGMKRCSDHSCRFCYERLDLTERFEPAMNFSTKQVHRFVNDYQVFLNCDVTCTTSNLIYALTCPCRCYDYIGECDVPFRNRMMQHRMSGCRIISNFLIGTLVAERLRNDRDPDPYIPDYEKKLYAHSTQCSVPLQLFLKCHPEYWCFVPMTNEQVLIDNARVSPLEINLLNDYQNSLFTATQTSQYTRDMTLVQWCVNHVPSPPLNYQFSIRQKIQQYEFFSTKSDIYVTRFLDLYNPAIVLALPENASDALRRTVQALLVVYAEPKLVDTTVTHSETALQSTDIIEPTIWCQHLVRP